MIKKKPILAVLSTLFILILPLTLSAGVIAKGSAQIFNNNETAASKQALNNALRDAVKQGVGLFLDSKTEVKNWVVIKDEIYSSARGFVKSYKLLRDEKKGNTWWVEIDAEVSSADIKGKLSELRLLHQKMGNKRLMVIYQPNHPEAMNLDHAAVSSALAALQSSLLDYGFRLFDHRSLGHIYDQISQKGAPTEEWVKIADQHQVNILVEFELLAGTKKPFSKSAFTAARTSIQAKSYDVSTGRLIASVGTTQKQMTNARVGSYDWNNALSKAGERAGKVVGDEITTDIIKYYETVGDIGNAYLMIFKDFSEDEEFEIMEILESLEGYQSLTELKNLIQLLEIEYFSSMDKSRMRRKLYLACKEKGIRLKTKEMSGNRFIFIKP
jgi:flagellar assembly FlgT-like protein